MTTTYLRLQWPIRKFSCYDSFTEAVMIHEGPVALLYLKKQDFLLLQNFIWMLEPLMTIHELQLRNDGRKVWASAREQVSTILPTVLFGKHRNAVLHVWFIILD